MTTLQPFEPGSPYLFNGVGIPSQQTLPPAGQQSFAFRPACTQLYEVSIPDDPAQVAWGMTYNNDFYRFSIKPAGLSREQAHLHLDAEGNCKIQGVDVPLVPVDILPQALLPEVSVAIGDTLAIAPEVAPMLPTTSIVGGVILLCGLGLMAFGLTRGRKTAVPTASADSPLSDLSTLMDFLNG